MPDGSLAMTLAVYGKHPAKGDFLEYGVPAALKPALEGWLDTVLAEAKISLGADWQAVWPAAPMLRFWLGEGIWGSAIAGVMAASQDRVGRRFPLVLLALGDAGLTLPPPVIDPDQTWYDAACVHLGAQLRRGDLPGPAALVQDAPQPVQTDALPEARDFWAARPGADVGGLLADIALTDHRRANDGRSYWWVAGTAEAVPDNSEPDTKLDEAIAAPDDAVAEPVAEDQTQGAADDMGGDGGVANTTIELVTADNDAAPSDWDLPDAPEIDASPFDTMSGGLSLFAAPEPGGMPEDFAEAAPQIPIAVPPKQLWSQVWAGPGLPSGAVLAWFFRGHAGND